MSLIENAIRRSRSSGTSPTAASERNTGDVPILRGSGGSATAADAAPLKVSHSVVLPRARLRACGLLAPDHFDRQLSDQYRRIKRPLLASIQSHNTPDRPLARSIVVCSGMPGDGKTFTSLNLAANLALEHDACVVLIDGDVAKRELTTLLDVSSRPGLLDVVAEADGNIDSAILGTDQSGLFFLPAGTPHSGASELLGSARIQQLVADFLVRNPTALVVFDSPPILVTSESRTLLLVAGQVVLVVRAGVTARQSVLDTIAAIGNQRSVALLLNDATHFAHGSYRIEHTHESPEAIPS
jgi:protein-tyrosine kinase